MFLGKQIRLNRLTNEKSGKYVGVTLDHSTGRGVLRGLENAEEIVKKMVAGRPNAITMHKGIAEKVYAPHAGKVPLVLKSTTFSPYHNNIDIPVADVEEAVRFGADAISVGLILGGPEQIEQVKFLAKISKAAASCGMPLIAHSYPRGSEIKEPKDHADYAVRVAAELGVDIIKTNWNGSVKNFAKAVQAAAPAKVVVAGGGDGETLIDYLRLAEEALQAGAFGVTFGRCVFSDEDPTAAIVAINAVVHDGKTATDAMNEYKNFRG